MLAAGEDISRYRSGRSNRILVVALVPIELLLEGRLRIGSPPEALMGTLNSRLQSVQTPSDGVVLSQRFAVTVWHDCGLDGEVGTLNQGFNVVGEGCCHRSPRFQQ